MLLLLWCKMANAITFYCDYFMFYYFCIEKQPTNLRSLILQVPKEEIIEVLDIVKNWRDNIHITLKLDDFSIIQRDESNECYRLFDSKISNSIFKFLELNKE